MRIFAASTVPFPPVDRLKYLLFFWPRHCLVSRFVYLACSVSWLIPFPCYLSFCANFLRPRPSFHEGRRCVPQLPLRCALRSRPADPAARLPFLLPPNDGWTRPFHNKRPFFSRPSVPSFPKHLCPEVSNTGFHFPPLGSSSLPWCPLPLNDIFALQSLCSPGLVFSD